MADNKQQLTKAFDLIRQDRLEEAISIIRPITEAEPNNPDAWWLLANAASDHRNARRALVNVLKLNSSYPKARDLLDKLNELHPPNDQELMMMMEIEDQDDGYLVATAPASNFFGEGDDSFEMSSEIDDLFSSSPGSVPASPFEQEDEPVRAPAESGGVAGEDWALPDNENPFEALLHDDPLFRAKSDEGGSSRKAVVAVLGAAAVVAIVLIAAIVVLSRGGGEAPQSNILVAVAPDAISADQASVLDLVRSSAESDARLQMGVDASAIFTKVEGGYALVVTTCAVPDPTLPAKITQGIEIAAKYGAGTEDLHTVLTMVGVNVSDCNNAEDTLYRAMAPMQSAIAFQASGSELAAAFPAFQQSWTVEN